MLGVTVDSSVLAADSAPGSVTLASLMLSWQHEAVEIEAMQVEGLSKGVQKSSVITVDPSDGEPGDFVGEYRATIGCLQLEGQNGDMEYSDSPPSCSGTGGDGRAGGFCSKLMLQLLQNHGMFAPVSFSVSLEGKFIFSNIICE